MPGTELPILTHALNAAEKSFDLLGTVTSDRY
jgi:hypothetical protein